MPKLPKKFKAAWVAALRSGKYKQGKSFLRAKDDDGKIRFCCLGVACDIKGHNPRTSQFIPNNFSVPKIIKGYTNVATGLADMNDEGKSFKRIATWIEKNL